MSSRRRNALSLKEVLSAFVMLPLIGLLVGIAVGGVGGGTPGLKVGFALAVILVVLTLIGQAAAASARTRSNLTRSRSRTIPQDVKIAVTLRDQGRCRICGSKQDLQYDHIIPYSRGGSSTDVNNIQLLCGRCNRLKSNRYVG